MKPASLAGSELTQILDESMTGGGPEEMLLLQLSNIFLQQPVPAIPPVPTSQSVSEPPNLQDRYKILVEQIPAVVFMLNLEGGIGEAYVSPQIEKSMGYTQEEWLEDPIRWYQHIHPDDKTRWSAEAAQMLMAGTPVRSIYRVIARDGHIVSLHCEVRMVRTADGKPWFIHGVGFDVTDLKKTEESLETERNFVSAILDTVGAVVVVLDSEGHILRFNRACEEITGYTLAEVQGKPVWEVFIAPREAHLLQAMFRRTQARPGRQEYESQWITRDGNTRLIALSGSALPGGQRGSAYTILTGIDVTERKWLEKRELERQAAKTEETLDLLQRLIDSMSESMFLVDFFGRIKKANRAANELLERQGKDPVGERFSDLIPNPEIPATPPKLLKRSPLGKLYLETQIQSSTDHVIPVSVSSVLVRDTKGKITGVLLVLQNIRERKQAEAALRRSEKLAAAGRLAATIAHEINNPLEAVTNLLYLARKKPSQAQRFLELADQELERVSHIAKQTLGFYRDSSSPSSISVSETIDNVLYLYGRRLETREIVVDKKYGPEVPIVAFAGELRQVFSNIISNAIDAIGQRGKISIKVSSGFCWKTRGTSGVRVTIGDSGSGIKPDHLKRIFEPFYTTKIDVGTGLGLWVSHGIVKKHHGSIQVRSTTLPGRSGTVFSIFLPADGAAVGRES
jgi:PAS domain S-box-containing protein